jgi:hypothetical protein
MKTLKKSNFHLKSAQGNLPNLIFRGSLIIKEHFCTCPLRGTGGSWARVGVLHLMCYFFFSATLFISNMAILLSGSTLMTFWKKPREFFSSPIFL